MSIDVLISREQIASRIKELASEIRADLPEGERLIVLGVLKGCFIFMSDLVRELDLDLQIDFLQVGSYGEGQVSSGVVSLKKDHEVNIQGRHVLLVEDIVDSGLTLKHLVEVLNTRKPASLKVVALLRKPEAVVHQAPVHYLGFEIENTFVVGYGLDHAERHRELPYVGVVRQEASS